MDHSLVLYPVDRHYGVILEYLYDNYSDKITNIVYNSDCSLNRYEYRFRRSKDRQHVKSILPYDCEFSFTKHIDSEEVEFSCKLEIVKDNKGNDDSYFHNLGHDGQEQRVLKKLTLTSSSNESLINFVDKAREVIREKHEENKKSTNETIRIFYFQKDFWNMLSKAPKRPIDTLYLKEGEKETFIDGRRIL